MKKYTVTAERSGNWWILQAVEAPAAITQIAQLDQADQIIEAIAFVTGEARSEITIEVQELNEEDVDDAIDVFLARNDGGLGDALDSIPRDI